MGIVLGFVLSNFLFASISVLFQLSVFVLEVIGIVTLFPFVFVFEVVFAFSSRFTLLSAFTRTVGSYGISWYEHCAREVRVHQPLVKHKNSREL